MNPVIESLLPLEDKLKFVSISSDYDSIITNLKLDPNTDDVAQIDWHNQLLNPRETCDATTRWLFTVSSLNFCFWQLDNTAYCVQYNNQLYSGYWALCAAIALGQSLGIDLTNAEYVNSDHFTIDELKLCFPDFNNRPVPLLKRRFEILKESSSTIVNKFGGSIVNLTDSVDSAIQLVKEVVRSFDSFKDECDVNVQSDIKRAMVRNKSNCSSNQNNEQNNQQNKEQMHLKFYKRAQIFVAELYHTNPKRYGFKDLDQLTLFADYRIPQMLHRFGLIQYKPELIAILQDKQHLMESGSYLECEIRAASILAVYRLAQKTGIKQITVDFLLWNKFKEIQAGSTESYFGGIEVGMHRVVGWFY
ncbi:Conserved_hypothetical protein [Hexamita inflata]|uniref:Queuosine 5'-phosphate N-glycosylase/hydrolase n=1 Tax=Hexamita inflata TaxID=28002 RepID=A0ABP1HLZ6_9EUKA